MFQKQTMPFVSCQLPSSCADLNGWTRGNHGNRQDFQHPRVEKVKYSNSVMQHGDGYRSLNHEKGIQGSRRKTNRKTRRVNQKFVNPIEMLMPYQSCDPDSVVSEDSSSEVKRSNDRKYLLDKITFFTLNAMDVPGDFRSCRMQFISVYPYTCVRSIHSDLIVYPAEISITKFSLEEGIISVVSNLVKFDKAFYGTEAINEIPWWDCENVKRNAQELGVPLDSSVGDFPKNIWKWVINNFDNGAITVCDCSQYSWVDKSLYWLASFSLEAMDVYEGKIKDRIYRIQDVALALVEYKKDVGLNQVEIQTTFDKPRVSLNEDYCAYHKKKGRNDNSKHMCSVALSYRKIHALYDVCRSCNLANFRDYFNESKHVLCSELVGLSVEENIIGTYSSRAGYPNSTRPFVHRDVIRSDNEEAEVDRDPHDCGGPPLSRIFRTSSSSMSSISTGSQFLRRGTTTSANFSRSSIESLLESTSKCCNNPVAETVSTTIDVSIKPGPKLIWNICTNNNWESPNSIKMDGKNSGLVGRFFKL